MLSAKVLVHSKNSKLVYYSLLPDTKSDKNHKIKLRLKKNKLIIDLKAKKLSHLRSVLNSYLSLVNLLEVLE